jgi:transcriptional regulator with XRE-family HTH domain
MDAPDVETQRVADALREAIRRRKISQREVERTLGQSKGYLSLLLNGNVDLKLKHVFAVLQVIGMEPTELFLSIYDQSDPLKSVRGLVQRAELDELMQRVARLEHGFETPAERSK